MARKIQVINGGAVPAAMNSSQIPNPKSQAPLALILFGSPGSGKGTQSKLLAKIEELTLHMIQADENIHRLEERNTQLEKEIHTMQGMGEQ